jgi:molybdate transport system regulatory protein
MALPRIRIRLVLQGGKAVGPGKADLLAAIDRLGSIAAAGRLMGMSYQRAWSLVEALNQTFREPLVLLSRGGATRGGATLTPMGHDVLARYRAIVVSAAASCEAELRALEKLERQVPTDISAER